MYPKDGQMQYFILRILFKRVGAGPVDELSLCQD
jgi:hypothetical protein